MATDDGFGLDLGGVSDFDATIVGAQFEMYMDFNGAPQAALQLTLQSDDGEVGDQGIVSGRDSQIRLGKDWEVDDDGWSVVDAQGRQKRKFHQNSHGGLFAARVLDLVPREELAKLGEGWKDAHTYLGLRFHWEQEAQEMKDRETGQTTRYSKLLPTEFLGIDEEAREGIGTDPTPVEQTASSAGSRTPAAPTPDTSLSDDQRNLLTALAEAADSPEKFQEAALTDPSTKDWAEQVWREIARVDEGSIWADSQK